jgi:hypothetical protein
VTQFSENFVLTQLPQENPSGPARRNGSGYLELIQQLNSYSRSGGMVANMA